MSGQSHWNPATEPDKVERPDMSGMGAGHVRPDWSFWWWDTFLMFCTSRTHPMYPP
jgi:hypothetical protein